MSMHMTLTDLWAAGRRGMDEAAVTGLIEASVPAWAREAEPPYDRLPHGGSREWLETNGDPTKLYQIEGYVWGYVEGDGWTKSDTQFLVVASEGAMTNAGGTPYLLRDGDTGTVYAYQEESGDHETPMYESLPKTANEGDVVAVGGRKYKASVTTTTEPAFTNLATDIREGYRISSSSGLSAQSGATAVADYIDFAVGDTVRVKGLDLNNTWQTGFYNSSQVSQSVAKLTFPYTSSGGTITGEYDEAADVFVFHNNGTPSYALMRFSGVLTGTVHDVIITVNEEIAYSTETTVTWTDIGAHTPPVDAGWYATEEAHAVMDTLEATADNGDTAVYSGDGYLYTYLVSAGWALLSPYATPSYKCDTALNETSSNAVENRVVSAAVAEIQAGVSLNKSNLTDINRRLTDMETGSDSLSIPDWWQEAVAECVATIKSHQVGRNCVTFPFFSDNHMRLGYCGVMIAYVMRECGIPYCFFGGDAITSAYSSTTDPDTEFKEQAAAFFDTMAYIPNGRFCWVLGNHEMYLKKNPDNENSVGIAYTSAQAYDIFLRGFGNAQNKHFGGEGTYYYVEDSPSKVRFVVLDCNAGEEQVGWVRDTALSFDKSGWAVVLMCHAPITNHYNSYYTYGDALIEVVTDYINGTAANKAEIVGCFSGHIHRDRIFWGPSVDHESDDIAENMGFAQVTITSDATVIAYEEATKHQQDNSDRSHAIDFVTVNRDTGAVNITRLGIGENRSYQYR